MIRDPTDRILRGRRHAGETAGLDQPQAEALDLDALARVLDPEAVTQAEVTPRSARTVIDGAGRVRGGTDNARPTATRVAHCEE